ncbi:Ger(x)C family spore germination protein [Paenibacillus methanolicus]|uniref:Spore germination protein KC n=1 Tax=Paenibacillus methanolicus TaxID=582686 RepID=A0A5S5CB26_9BACL|nr:Ger(x)C family spore germination protein [Paenibacillus methanolicus]TYP76527.1 spore germination protein KC [Paenibacillus methanolicus]
MTKRICILLLMFQFLLVTGCWNSRELRDLAIVVGIGVDRIEGSDQYRVSFQLVNPRAATGGKVGGSSISEIPNIVFTSDDHSMFSALRKTTQKVPRQLFFAHSQLLVIGESLAKEGVSDVLDFFERSHEMRLNTSVVIARGASAESILKVITPLSPTSATAIIGRLKVATDVWAHNVNEDIGSVIKKLAGGGEPAISGIRILGSPTQGRAKSNLDYSKPPTILELKGVSLFSEGKLVGWVEGKSARGVVWALNQMKSTNVSFPCEDGEKGVSIEVIRSFTKIRSRIVDGSPRLSVKVKEEGSLSEAQCKVDPGSNEDMMKLRRHLAEETKAEIRMALKAAQAKKSDIFGFAAEVKRTSPKYWKTIEGDWPSIFADCEIDVDVEAYVRRTGMRTKSLMKTNGARTSSSD